jgi:hypothetical protein
MEESRSHFGVFGRIYRRGNQFRRPLATSPRFGVAKAMLRAGARFARRRNGAT